MKLNLLFVIMYVLTLLAYPVVFIHGKLRQLSTSKEGLGPEILLISVSAVSGK